MLVLVTVVAEDMVYVGWEMTEEVEICARSFFI